MPDEEAILRRCAWRAAKGLAHGLTRDDLLQEGRIAIWLARTAGRIPRGDEAHASRYIAQRAYGAMVDASRQAWSQRPITVDELAPEHEASDDSDRPDTRAQLAQAIEILARTGSSRVNECLGLVSSGSSYTEAARAMGITASRVSQLLHEARQILARCF